MDILAKIIMLIFVISSQIGLLPIPETILDKIVWWYVVFSFCVIYLLFFLERWNSWLLQASAVWNL